ncbi:fructosamine kinase family protein [Terrimonas alba]|uniref:fructosamine kinase family protein n=1 Tax=Terrimonas alba TaxID=3349636 RepID=UPI0035F2CA65
MTIDLQPFFKDCGLSIKHHQPVHGGDINECYCLQTNDEKYFLKVNDSHRYPAMFEKEAHGLDALRSNSSLMIPMVVKSGVVNSSQYLLLEWIEPGSISSDFWKRFGAALAAMHLQQQTHFGWKEDNYIGSLQQVNTPHVRWSSFYAECRIMPLVKTLADTHAFTKIDVSSGITLCKKLHDLFPDEPPSLLHGDLWSGNYMAAKNGKASLFDPAVYYGHREMDIGMTLLFGGFSELFYEGYNEVYSLETGWQQRLQLTQLYPLLVHAVLFGGHYVGSCREIIRRFS